MMGSWSQKRNKYAEEITSFIHQNPQRCLSLPTLYMLLDLYENWRVARNKSNREKKIRLNRSDPCERYFLHYIAERAFWSNIEDGKYVAKLLVALHRVEKHFGYFLCPEETFFFPPLMSLNESENHLAIFFLNHAYREKLTFSGQRIADMRVFCRSEWTDPFFMAIKTESSQLLLLLLQYGLLLNVEPVFSAEVAPIRQQNGCARLTVYTFILLFTSCIVSTIIPLHHSGPFSTFQATVQCAILMMRVCPQIDKTLLFKKESTEPPSDEEINWIAENYVPELRFRISVPMTLKHACRLTVRRLLHNNWQLPHGIDELQMPEQLKSYINICCD